MAAFGRETLTTMGIYQMLEDLVEDDRFLPHNMVQFYNVIAAASLTCPENDGRPKVEGFVANVVEKWTPSEFRRHFRVNRFMYDHLLNELYHDLEKQYPGGKEPLSPETKLLVFLWYVANQDSQREIAVLFGVSEWSVNIIIKDIAELLSKRLDNYVKFPNEVREENIAESFEESCGIPNIIGALDGTHIPIVNCPGGNQDYINRKGYASIQLQLVVDDNLIINNCYAGWPGSTHDARVLRNSQLYLDAEQGNIISGNNFIIGDGAYPLRRWLLTPYRDNGHLSERQKKFNKKLSSARQCVERANAHLKGRFRRLQKVYSNNVELICKLITSCCILHNLCIICDDEIEDFIDMDQADNVNNYINIFQNFAGVEAARDAIAASL